jgi:hypothetical protein
MTETLRGFKTLRGFVKLGAFYWRPPALGSGGGR